MNPYTYFGVLVVVPKVDTEYQIPDSFMTSATNHLTIDFAYRWLEWNENFDFAKA